MTSSTHLTPTLIHLDNQMQKAKRITTFSSQEIIIFLEKNLGKARNKPRQEKERESERASKHAWCLGRLCIFALLSEKGKIERKKSNPVFEQVIENWWL